MQIILNITFLDLEKMKILISCLLLFQSELKLDSTTAFQYEFIKKSFKSRYFLANGLDRSCIAIYLHLYQEEFMSV